MKNKLSVIKNDCGAFVSGYNSTLEESIVTRCEKDFKFFNSRDEAWNFIQKYYYEDDMEIVEWTK